MGRKRKKKGRKFSNMTGIECNAFCLDNLSGKKKKKNGGR